MDRVRRIARIAFWVLAWTVLLGSSRAGVVGPEFEGAIEGREFEPETAFARIERGEAGDSIRVYIDEVASSCEELDEVRGARIVLGPFVYRPGRSIPAANANASHSFVDPSGSTRSGRFTTGEILVRHVGRDAPSVPFELGLDLEDVRGARSYARGDVFVTPCVLTIR